MTQPAFANRTAQPRPVGRVRRWLARQRGRPVRSPGDLAGVDLSGPASGAAVVAQLLDLQREAGNAAVTELLQRAPDPTPTPGPTGNQPATAPAAAPAPNPLDDTRIKWIDELPTLVRSSIDVASQGTEARYKALEDSLAKQKAAVDAAKTDEDKKAATEKLASSPEAKEKEKLDKVQGKTWATRRLALMDYLGCQLGGDVGVERYFRALVQIEGDLYAHPEAARRLEKVKEELAKERIPMPKTDNGFALRGRHTHGRVEGESPGMMTHALGVAIDWEAYKNVHIRDESLMALISSVTGNPHFMQLPKGGLETIKALGEQSMGNKLTAAQQKIVEDGGDKLIDKIGAEFDRLSDDSDKFRDSLGTFDKDALMTLHEELKPYGQKIRDLQDQLGQTSGAGRKQVQAKLVAAQDEGAKKMAENKAKLEQLFKPWLDALKATADATRKEAEPLLKGKQLEAVMTNEGLKWRSQTVAAGTKDIAKELAALDKQSSGSLAKLGGVRNGIAGAQVYLEKSGTEQDKADWGDKLKSLEARAAAAAGRATTVRTESLVLRGNASATAAAEPQSKARKPNWAKDVAAWEAEVTKQETAVSSAEANLATTTEKATPDARTEAYKLRDDRAANEQIRAQVKAADFEKLQQLKVRLWNAEHAADRLLTDPSFMFAHGDVHDPGVAQITGVLKKNAEDKPADIGGGGFFGTPQSAKDAAAKIPAGSKQLPPRSAGFSKRFFQVMVKYGFEPAATWRTADSMHFQLAGLSAAIVPTRECLEPPPEAESKAKTDKEKEEIAKERTSAAAARGRGEDYSKGAEASRGAWDAAHKSK